MKTNPLVSVIIPTYNRASVLATAIRSALAQTYPNVEIIVVDDGSQDNTAQLMEAFPSVQYVIQEHAGQGAARSRGLKLAKGTLIASLDSDDYWEPQFLEQTVALLEDNNLDFVFANWIQETKDGGQIDFCRFNPYLEHYFEQQPGNTVLFNSSELRYMYIRACLSPSSSLLVRASSMVSGWSNQMNIADDWCMLLDMLLNKACTAGFIKEPLWRKTVVGDNIFDGRSREEVYSLLYVADAKVILERHMHLLTVPEQKFLKKRYLEYLVRSAKNNMRTNGKVIEGVRMMQQAVFFHPLNYARIFSKLMMQTVMRKWHEMAE
ncbi:glycosyltransferase family 2 protein [Pseudocnuella soli]|uniref:glycosyltransferase family 2 protein n=1 Tax=Pseudocnuella soli TaxID=2502779 RepID=UPI00104B84FF|nr:glycosyltransferase [Pseudocnuella soli]